MKSGTRSSSTASPLLQHSPLFKQRLKNSTLAATFPALPGGSLLKPSVRTRQHQPWSSQLPAKTLQIKPSAEASHSLAEDLKCNATYPSALTLSAPNAWPLATTLRNVLETPPAAFAPANIQLIPIPAPEQIVLPRGN